MRKASVWVSGLLLGRTIGAAELGPSATPEEVELGPERLARITSAFAGPADKGKVEMLRQRGQFDGQRVPNLAEESDDG